MGKRAERGIKWRVVGRSVEKGGRSVESVGVWEWGEAWSQVTCGSGAKPVVKWRVGVGRSVESSDV